MKTCSKCGHEKPLDAFDRRHGAPDGHDGRCRECKTARARERYAARRSDDFDEQPTNPSAPAFDDIAVNENVPDGHRLRGLSTLVDGAGNVRLRWVKSKVSEEQYLEALLDTARVEFETWRGLAPPAPAPKHTDDSTLSCLVFGDPHVGMYAWPEETGDAAWDIKIAEDTLNAALDHAIAVGPPSERALLAILGDNFHADNGSNTTTAGTKQDVDTRWQKVLGVGVRIWRRAIDRLLERHGRVDVMPVRGNHDEHTSAMLAMLLAQVYERDPRVSIDTTPSRFHYVRFGANLIAATHGHTCKPEKLPAVMAADRPEDWGQTRHRRWVVGHVHHSRIIEYPGCTVEEFPTLAPRCAWSAAAGYRSSRSMSLLVFDREHGLVNRHTIGIQRVQAIMNGNV